MNFRPEPNSDELDINLIPLIDVLLVILIFLAATTTFSRFSQLEITLPEARAQLSESGDIYVTISRDGIYAMDGRLLSGNTSHDIAQALKTATSDPVQTTIIINADASASHDSVVRVMEAAQATGIRKIYFATQSPH